MYKITKSKTILEHQDELLNDCKVAYDLFNHLHNPDNIEDFPTQAHYTDENGKDNGVMYNIFTLTATSVNFYNLYKELCEAIRDHLGHDQPLWLSAWINFDKHDKVLNWHGHDFPWHGYISIDPKNTKTVFDEWEVENETGNIYVGPGSANHKVEVLEPYEGHRITIGYDVLTDPGDVRARLVAIPVL